MTGSITIKLNLPDLFCADVMCTALEGGIGYWCCAAKLKRTAVDPRTGDWLYVSFTATDAEGEDAFPPAPVDYGTIRTGIERILSGAVKIRADLTAAILRDVLNQDDAGNIDAEAADCIVQAGLFNEITFG